MLDPGVLQWGTAHDDVMCLGEQTKRFRDLAALGLGDPAEIYPCQGRGFTAYGRGEAVDGDDPGHEHLWVATKMPTRERSEKSRLARV